MQDIKEISINALQKNVLIGISLTKHDYTKIILAGGT